MSDPNKQYAYFAIQGSFDPGQVTDRVGIQPTESWRKGETHPRSGYERRVDYWSLHSRLAHDEELEAHIFDVLELLNQNAEAFQAVSKEFGGVMQLVGYFNSSYPGLHFEKPLIEGLAKFGLAVDFDFYYLYSNAREGT
jgi:hypothetical protein